MRTAYDVRMATVLTIGHSNRTAEAFVALLREHDVVLLVDVRRFPGSRKWPQFGREALMQTLRSAGIEYDWMESLGGRRSSKDAAGQGIDPDTTAGWENKGFRAYAAYMQTPEFHDALARFLARAVSQRTAIMCSEALWWQCHRRMISDALVALGHDVQHIMGDGETKPHRLTDFACADNGHVTYPSPLFGVSPRPDQREASAPAREALRSPSHATARCAQARY